MELLGCCPALLLECMHCAAGLFMVVIAPLTGKTRVLVAALRWPGSNVAGLHDSMITSSCIIGLAWLVQAGAVKV